MKKILYSSLSFFIFTALLVAGPAKSEPAAGEPIKLKAVHFLPSFMDISKEFVELTNRINKRTGDKLEIKVIGGPDVIPPPQQGEALRKGIIDCLMCPTEYYKSLLPEATVFHLSKLTPEEERESGFYDFMVERHKKFGVFYVGRTRAYDPFFVYTSKKINKLEDFAGLKLGRSAPLCVPLFKELGAAVVTVGAGEFYSALERGVVDGVGHPSDGITGLNLHEVSDYLLEEPVYLRNSTVFLINLEVFNDLPEDIQKVITDTTIAWEKERLDKDKARVKSELNIGKQNGLKMLQLPPHDSQEYFDLAYQVEWDDLKEDVPDLYPKLRSLLKQ
ncbi:MAG: TRAP transporter substrate-binding protein DctP [Desulfobacteraceae bacterium]|nr:TRAP transporter substrate-binding protein DctP [Desulfobacteraceae bacterium]